MNIWWSLGVAHPTRVFISRHGNKSLDVSVMRRWLNKIALLRMTQKSTLERWSIRTRSLWGQGNERNEKGKKYGKVGRGEIVFPDGNSACRTARRNAKIWPIARSFISSTDVAYITRDINILVPVTLRLLRFLYPCCSPSLRPRSY